MTPVTITLFLYYNETFLLKIYFKNQTPAPGTTHPAHLGLEHVLALVTDSFTSATERHIEVCTYLLRVCIYPLTAFRKVGDGLEMYVVLAKGRSAHGLEGAQGVQEMPTTEGGERVFVVRRELKKD